MNLPIKPFFAFLNSSKSDGDKAMADRSSHTVRCVPKSSCYSIFGIITDNFRIVTESLLSGTEIVRYNPENTVSASHEQWQYRDKPKTFSGQDSFIMQ
jgi:hypothetical protein